MVKLNLKVPACVLLFSSFQRIKVSVMVGKKTWESDVLVSAFFFFYYTPYFFALCSDLELQLSHLSMEIRKLTLQEKRG